jgi:copper chaperone CopZ
MAQVSLSIEGMSCGNCVAHVKKTLEKLSGVTPESVEIGRAVVSYDPDVTEPARIEAALTQDGYPARAAFGA